jgi:hypothetical protein
VCLVVVPGWDGSVPLMEPGAVMHSIDIFICVLTGLWAGRVCLPFVDGGCAHSVCRLAGEERMVIHGVYYL